MKSLIYCPKCHDTLVNTTIQIRNGVEVWKKSCDKKLDHSFLCAAKDSDDSVIFVGMTLSHDKSLKVFWNFTHKQIVIHKSESLIPFPAGSSSEIPWFEPKFEEYDNLVKKIKKYILFS